MEDFENVEHSEHENVVVDDKINNHKTPGKHKLKQDSIFKGRKKTEDEEIDDLNLPIQNLTAQRHYCDMVSYGEESDRIRRLKVIMHDIIKDKTKINLKNSRRKPSRIDFNDYYRLMCKEIDSNQFTRTEIFVELSGYFSDNVYSMFKLLDKNFRVKIVNDLVNKYNIDIDTDNINFF